jgi:RimJ/RimL family protein N-acetyltransferase
MMADAQMQPTFLTGERLYVRAMRFADKEQAIAWFEGPFPVNAPRAETFLREVHHETWHPPTTYLAIVRLETDEVVGGVRMWSHDRRSGYLRITMAPCLADADGLRADALRLLIPWWRDEHEFMEMTVELPADEPKSIAAAEALGMVLNTRWRESVARPGHFVDLLVYQALNARWEAPDA